LGPYRIINQNGLYFLTMTVVDWIDVFARQCYRDLLIESFKYCQKEKGLVVNAYVIMTNHIHLIGYTRPGYSISNTIRDFKKFTAKQIIATIKSNPSESRKVWLVDQFRKHGQQNLNNQQYQFWQQYNHPVELSTPKWISQKLDYIHMNPVRAGIVENPEDYSYSSARQYLGKPGFMDIEIIALGVTEGFIDL
jgi:putative transposase